MSGDYVRGEDANVAQRVIDPTGGAVRSPLHRSQQRGQIGVHGTMHAREMSNAEHRSLANYVA